MRPFTAVEAALVLSGIGAVALARRHPARLNENGVREEHDR